MTITGTTMRVMAGTGNIDKALFRGEEAEGHSWSGAFCLDGWIVNRPLFRSHSYIPSPRRIVQ